MGLVFTLLPFTGFKTVWRIAFVMMLLVPGLTWGQSITYTWTGNGGNANWSNELNWTPTRIVAATDILIFDPLATPVSTPTAPQIELDFSANETVAQLRFLNGVRVSFSTNAARSLTINGSLPGADFEVSGVNTAGTPTGVQFNGSAAVQVALLASAQGSVTAGLTFGGASHTITAAASESLVFGVGGSFTAASALTGNPFGASGAINSVVFQSGSIYTQLAGASPFGNTASAVARFDKGSRFIARSSPAAFNNRTFGTLELAANLTSTGTGILNVLNDLEVTTGTTNLNLTTINIAGNVIVNGGAVNFSGGPTSIVRFNGTTPQSITGTGGNTLVLDGSLEVNNPAGLTLLRPVRANNGLVLTSGIVRTTISNPLTLSATAAVTGGSMASFVDGPLSREVSGTGQIAFPIGEGTAYRQLKLNITSALTGTTTYTAEQNEGASPDQVLLGDIRSISRSRYFTVNSNPVPALGAFAGTIELSFGANDGVLNPGSPAFVVAKSNGSGWSNIGHSSNTNTTLVSSSFNSFGDFILASTDPVTNPLPVTLTNFAANWITEGIELRWTTATEENNATFEVQRSDAGRNFTTIATVAGEGQSSTTQQYTALDKQPLAGLNYYHLRQTDYDGSEAYSRVVVVEARQELVVYPNPVRNILTIAAPAANTRYRVLTPSGAVVLEGAVDVTNPTLDVSGLPAGLYQLEISAGIKRTLRRFARQI